MLKKYAKYIYLILIFYLVWLIVLPCTCNLIYNAFSEKIQTTIKSTTGLNLEVKNFRIRTSLLPNISIKANEINAYKKDGNKSLEVIRPKINIRILPIFVGKIHINKLSADNIQANFALDNKNNLYLGDYLIPKLEVKIEPNKFDIKKINLKKYNIKLYEKGRKNEFTGGNLKFKNTHKHLVFKSNSTINKTCLANFDLDLSKTRKIKKSKCNIEVKNLNLADFSPIITSYFKDIKSTNGKINITTKKDHISTSITGLRIDYFDKASSIIFPKEVKINSYFKIYNNTLDIKHIFVETNGLKTDTTGKIKNLISRSPRFDITTDVKCNDLRSSALMLPNIETVDIDTQKIKKYPFYGTMNGKIAVKGCLPTPDMYGELKIRDGILEKPIPRAKGNANIDINFAGKKLLLNVDVPAGDNEWVKVYGDINIYGDKFAHLFVKSSESVCLDVAEFVVNRLHEFLKFEVGPVPIMDIKGFGSADLKIVGTKKDPHIWGIFKFRNTSAKFLEVNNLELKNASGILEFKDRVAYFINKTGTLHGKPATVEGTCTLFGDLDFNVTAKNQKLSDLLTIITTSKMLEFAKPMVPELTNVKGNADFILNLKGQKVLHIEDLKINENVIPQGYIKLLGNSFMFENLNIKNMKGLITFKRTDCDVDLKGNLSKNSNITIKGYLQDNLANLKIITPRIVVTEVFAKELKFIDNLAIKLDAKYKGNIQKIDVAGIDAKIDILKNNQPVKNCKISSGQLTLKHSTLRVQNLYGYLQQNPFSANFSVKNITNRGFDINKSKFSGNFKCKNFDLTALNTLKSIAILPTELQNIISNINVTKGITDIDFEARNNNLNSVLNLNNIDFTYAIKEGEKQEIVNVPIKLINGQVILKNNTINLKKMNCLIDEMPILFFGKVNNIYKNPKYNIYINSKLVQNVFTKYWNAYNIYPIKVVGDIVSTITVSGDKNHTHINSNTKMEENSSIYYMGATIGDALNPITLSIDADVHKQETIKLNKFSYSKLIASQNNKQNELPLLNITGEIRKKGKIYNFKNLTIKSKNPADASLFNIIFKKPTIKQGAFVSDLNISGSSTNPKILGTFNLANVEMPYLNTTIKELNLNFKPKTINIISKGEVMSNYIMGSVELNNVLTPPYTVNDAYVFINSLDINNLINQIKQLELKGISSAISTDLDTTTNSIGLFKIKNARIRAGQILIKNITASNLEAICTLDKKKLAIESFNFDMAEGIISGNLKYNLKNNFMNMSLSANKVNANSLTTALFDLPNQIYGDLTGQIEISCDATNDKTRNNTLNGFGNFNVANGKMPKLGSLEYLLKASNLLKGGITSISMNSIIDIVTPMEKGEFSNIHGRFRIKDGMAKTVEIHSIGKNLSLYITGTYDFINTVANMKVYGQLSRKISTVLGAAGNISLNSLFNKIPGVSTSQFINDLNKIPGIDLSNKSTRRFVVEILGDINGEDFVKSFKWIN